MSDKYDKLAGIIDAQSELDIQAARGDLTENDIRVLDTAQAKLRQARQDLGHEATTFIQLPDGSIQTPEDVQRAQAEGQDLRDRRI